MRFDQRLIIDNKTFFVSCVLLIACYPNELILNFLRLNLNVGAQEFFSQPWRLITGHIVHSSWTHLFLNLLNFLLLRLVFYEWLSVRVFISVILVCALVISLGLWWIGDLAFYVGFSGIIHGLLVYLLLNYRSKHPILFSMILVFVFGKIIYEQLYGASPDLVAVIGVNVATDSHALGVLASLSYFTLKRKFQTKYE